LERLAEDGNFSALASEFSQQAGRNGVDATVFGLGQGAAGPIDPGETTALKETLTAAISIFLAGQLPQEQQLIQPLAISP